jgi:hypothetical protein
MLEEIVPITSEHDQVHNTNIKVADFEDAVRKIIFTNILENELHVCVVKFVIIATN